MRSTSTIPASSIRERYPCQSSPDWLSSAGQDLVRSLVRGLNMGGTYGEEVCLVAGVDKNKPAAELDAREIDRVHQALQEVFLDETLDPHIVLQDGEPVDVLSRPLKIYEGLEQKRFATFSEALDAFFVDRGSKGAQNRIRWIAG